ncbi:hypothetical protein B0T09DRAFT_256899, partial [Sordaria sp. MPI-SDFR-AT-0083]
EIEDELVSDGVKMLPAATRVALDGLLPDIVEIVLAEIWGEPHQNASGPLLRFSIYASSRTVTYDGNITIICTLTHVQLYLSLVLLKSR